MKIKLTIFLLILIFAFIGLGYSASYFGDDFVSLIHHISDYITLFILLLSITYIIMKIDIVCSLIPMSIIVLNTGTLALLFLMYFLYDFFSFSTITQALSAIGFNIVTGLSAIAFVADLCFLPTIIREKK
jgi:hypothetical protein